MLPTLLPTLLGTFVHTPTRSNAYRQKSQSNMVPKCRQNNTNTHNIDSLNYESTNKAPNLGQNLIKTFIKRKTTVLTVGVFSGMLMLSGCASKPVYQTNTGPKVQLNSNGVPSYYQVKSGDTVSQIAQRYGLNYRQVGAMNQLDSRYTIHTGQWLKLWQGQPAQGNASNQRAVTQPVSGRAANSVYRRTEPVSTNSPYTPSTSNTGSGQVLQGFRYPSTNPVVKNFDANAGVMSMWFSGRLGDPIMASRAGEVLYSGSELAEYGNLVMIRHDDTYITVYAHNDSLLVSEGERVQAGQRIATMGRSGQTNQIALEFQIRQNGSPVDPRALLSVSQ